ncbi:MAG: ABC transporter permease [Dehalococcoidia bacterium]
MNAFANHFSFEFRTGMRDRTLLLMNYLFPIGLYAMLGLLMAELNPPFIETMVPAMIVVAILSGTILGLPNPLVAAREAGIFRSYKINGVPATSILTIPALATILHMVVVAAIITITAPLFFSAPSPINWPGFVLVFLLTAFACAGLGMLIGVISSSTNATVLWAQLIFLPSMMIGGLMIPLSTLPDSLSKVGLLLPATHAMNAFQGLAQNQVAAFEPLWSVLILLAGGILSFGLANYLFSWDSHNTTRRGHPALALLALLPYAVGVVWL